MAPFDRSYDFLSVGRRRLSIPFSSYLTMNNRNLEMWVIMSLKVIQTGTIKNLSAVSYSPSIVTMAVS